MMCSLTESWACIGKSGEKYASEHYLRWWPYMNHENDADGVALVGGLGVVAQVHINVPYRNRACTYCTPGSKSHCTIWGHSSISALLTSGCILGWLLYLDIFVWSTAWSTIGTGNNLFHLWLCYHTISCAASSNQPLSRFWRPRSIAPIIDRFGYSLRRMEKRARRQLFYNRLYISNWKQFHLHRMLSLSQKLISHQTRLVIRDAAIPTRVTIKVESRSKPFKASKDNLQELPRTLTDFVQSSCEWQ